MYKAKKKEIIAKRQKIGLKASQLSVMAGLPENAVGRIERGDQNLTQPLRAKAIAKALQCKIEDIFEIN